MQHNIKVGSQVRIRQAFRSQYNMVHDYTEGVIHDESLLFMGVRWLDNENPTCLITSIKKCHLELCDLDFGTLS
jgi:hypothetical protein